jgi:hypothetical protein
MTNRVLPLVLLCLVAPTPAYAMIELLPVFFACAGLVVVLGSVPFAALLKRRLMGVLFQQGAVVSWKALYIVTCVEAAIMACSFLLFLVSMGSGVGPHTQAGMVFSAIFACSTILYSVVAMMPNLWLLKRTHMRSHDNGEPLDHPVTAWLLSLPTPVVMVLCVVAFYAAAR